MPRCGGVPEAVRLPLEYAVATKLVVPDAAGAGAGFAVSRAAWRCAPHAANPLRVPHRRNLAATFRHPMLFAPLVLPILGTTGNPRATTSVDRGAAEIRAPASDR